MEKVETMEDQAICANTASGMQAFMTSIITAAWSGIYFKNPGFKSDKRLWNIGRSRSGKNRLIHSAITLEKHGSERGNPNGQLFQRF